MSNDLIALLNDLMPRINQHTKACDYGSSDGDEGDFCTCGKSEVRKKLQKVIDALTAAQDKAHTDHPATHWDRTCPACQEAAQDTKAAGPVGEVEGIDYDDEGTASAWFTLQADVELGTKLYTAPPTFAAGMEYAAKICDAREAVYLENAKKSRHENHLATEDVFNGLAQGSRRSAFAIRAAIPQAGEFVVVPKDEISHCGLCGVDTLRAATKESANDNRS